MEVIISFDIFFQQCRFTGSPIIKQNPFTGEHKSILPNEPLTADELQAVQQVLNRVKPDGPDEQGDYSIRLDDGSEVEIYITDLATGFMVALRKGGITAELTKFLFELLLAGKWVMLPAMEDSVAITTSEGCLKNIPDDFPRVVVCNSAEELGVLLADGVHVWEKYRDQIVGDSE